MKVLVYGGRTYVDAIRVDQVLAGLHHIKPITLLIDGACHEGGADLLGHQWAVRNKIATARFWVDGALDGYHKRAPFHRNQRMLDESRPDFAVGFPGGPGTRDMRTRLRDAKVDQLIVRISGVTYETNGQAYPVQKGA